MASKGQTVVLILAVILHIQFLYTDEQQDHPRVKREGTNVLRFSIKLIMDFDFSSTARYNMTFTKVIDNVFSRLPGYVASKVIGFRPGSLIADFEITASSQQLNLSSVIKDLASGLTAEGLNANGLLFSRIEQYGLYGKDVVYPGETLMLTCNISGDSVIVWTKDGSNLPQSGSANNLTVASVTPGDSGEYACTTTWKLLPYVASKRITVLPYPRLQTTNDRVVKCENPFVLQYCVQEYYYMYCYLNRPTAFCYYYMDPQTGCDIQECKIYQPACRVTETKLLFTCWVWPSYSADSYSEKTITITATNNASTCYDVIYGAGSVGDTRTGDCDSGLIGNKTARCDRSGKWELIAENCVLHVIQNLKDKAENLIPAELPTFVGNLSIVSTTNALNIVASSGTILTIVEVLKKIASISQTVIVSKGIMMDFLNTVDVIGSAQEVWKTLNQNKINEKASSDLLRSVEDFIRRLSNESFEYATDFISIKRTSNTSSLSVTFGKKQSTQISIPQMSGQATIMVFSGFSDVLPVRTQTYSGSDTRINGDVVVVQTNPKVNKLSLTYVVINEKLGNPQCVFWNFNLLDGFGGWDSTGCELKLRADKRITCECDHTTSFSILMSPNGIALSYITYTGVGISLISLILCLIIEIIVWKAVTKTETSYLHNFSIVNIALSLLIADICFIVRPAVIQNPNLCSAATFFIHFFYLALFFWMLLSALFLLYCIIMIYFRMSRTKMMAIAFSVGYGAPLLIAVITVASTDGSKGYIQEGDYCWLNWDKTKTLLAFVIPVLTIVVINLLVLIVVLCKMLRRGVITSTQPQEKQVLPVIMKCVGILTPLFGLTWGFGVGTMVSKDIGIHVVFAFLNSLQGFFILVLGTLMDARVREALAGRLALSNPSTEHTQNTSAEPPICLSEIME